MGAAWLSARTGILALVRALWCSLEGAASRRHELAGCRVAAGGPSVNVGAAIGGRRGVLTSIRVCTWGSRVRGPATRGGTRRLSRRCAPIGGMLSRGIHRGGIPSAIVALDVPNSACAPGMATRLVARMSFRVRRRSGRLSSACVAAARRRPPCTRVGPGTGTRGVVVGVSINGGMRAATLAGTRSQDAPTVSNGGVIALVGRVTGGRAVAGTGGAGQLFIWRMDPTPGSVWGGCASVTCCVGTARPARVCAPFAALAVCSCRRGSGGISRRAGTDGPTGRPMAAIARVATGASPAIRAQRGRRRGGEDRKAATSATIA